MEATNNVYAKALIWANNMGASSTANQMRQFLMSLYRPSFYAYSVGKAVQGMDVRGKYLVLDCLTHYMARGESLQLVHVGKMIDNSGYLARFTDLCSVSQDARDELEALWLSEREFEA